MTSSVRKPKAAFTAKDRVRRLDIPNSQGYVTHVDTQVITVRWDSFPDHPVLYPVSDAGHFIAKV